MALRATVASFVVTEQPAHLARVLDRPANAPAKKLLGLVRRNRRENSAGELESDDGELREIRSSHLQERDFADGGLGESTSLATASISSNFSCSSRLFGSTDNVVDERIPEATIAAADAVEREVQ